MRRAALIWINVKASDLVIIFHPETNDVEPKPP
jgi:hypothetical protein